MQAIFLLFSYVFSQDSFIIIENSFSSIFHFYLPKHAFIEKNRRSELNGLFDNFNQIIII